MVQRSIDSALEAIGNGDLPAAEDLLRQVLDEDAGNGAAHHNLANLLRLSGRFRDAATHYRLALEHLPDAAEIHHSLAHTLEELGDYQQAEGEYRRAIELKPDFAEARFDLGLLLLAAGRYIEGWPCFESRTEVFREHGALPFPNWHGEDLRGKTILLLPEQGYGDTIQFVRYVALLKARGAATVSVLCKPVLAPLLRTVEHIDALITDPQSLRPHDYWVSLMSLPHRFGTTLDSIPAKVPYAGLLGNRLPIWKARLPAEGLRVGLVWKGNPGHDNDARRSLRHFVDLSPLWSVPGIKLVSLQVGDAEDETDACQQSRPIVRLGREIRDFGDTAAIVAQLNLVICVDTAVAHLAGALGIACWVMLPQAGVDWRWQRHGSASPWYPEGMFLFRQDDRGWPGVIDDVKRALTDIVRQRRS